MTETINIIILVLGIIVATGIISYFSNKYDLTDKLFGNIKSSKEAAELILEVLNLEDIVKNKTKFVLDLADKIADYAHQISDKNEDKQKLALELLHTLSEDLGLVMSESEEKLAKIVIFESLKWLEKQLPYTKI